jgi:hypothetical protein
MQIYKKSRSFKKEFRRQLRMAVMAALGFTVAFAWREAIYSSSKDIIIKLSETTHVILTEILTALFITLVCIIAIFLTTYLLREPSKKR